LSEVLRSEFRFYFKRILRQAGFAKGMAFVPLCFIKKKKYKKVEKIFINKNSSYQF